jgi:hypothetical protein
MREAAMREASVRNFKIRSNQYEVFRFSIMQPTTLFIRMIATAPVNLLLLDSEDKISYERGRGIEYSYREAWGRRSYLEEAVNVDAGTWYLIVEGRTEPSSGRIEVLQY